ncbi:hypothetical protein [Paenibacillus sp. WLX2291]|uniref:hypothetical protein n=1 Tax=Paenibacillus sp. WLX2291 TaxID=3296934 RepID=UPI003984161E
MIRWLMVSICMLLLWGVSVPVALADHAAEGAVQSSDSPVASSSPAASSDTQAQGESYRNGYNYSIALNMEDGIYRGYEGAYGQSMTDVLFPIMRAEIGHDMDFYDFFFGEHDAEGNPQFAISFRVYDGKIPDLIKLRTRLNTISWLTARYPITPGKPLVARISSIWR